MEAWKASFFRLISSVVVVDLDRLRGGFATVDDARYLASATQAAARTRSLQRARLRVDFKLHGDTPEYFPIRDQSGKVEKT